MKILVIQTAFIGDVILATAVASKLKRCLPACEVHFLVRKGNEELLQGHPHIDRVLVWNKREDKLRNLWKVIGEVRAQRYDRVVNLHRFASSGWITVLSRAAHTIGFSKNPMSFLFNEKFPHVLGSKDHPGPHEVQRNLSLVRSFTDDSFERPLLVPSPDDEAVVRGYTGEEFITISPASVWFTKQWPSDRWAGLIRSSTARVYLLGGKGDVPLCESLQQSTDSHRVVVLAGKLSLLQSAALMRHAQMNYVNDSAPMHLCSAVNAPVTAVFCSTIPEFGFGPLSDVAVVAETKEPLHCRPCGLHGHRQCPKGHFKCAEIEL
ncbi:MAG: glycosyltransferase family 9 protein [Flavobacteriales bacterium]|nr:glycosyltransferase family 9 protein [Flavobacteriales bacterium]